MTTEMRNKLLSIKQLNTNQLMAAIGSCDEMIAETRNQMKKMGTRFKLRVAIPKLRDLDLVHKTLTAELNLRTAKKED